MNISGPGSARAFNAVILLLYNGLVREEWDLSIPMVIHREHVSRVNGTELKRIVIKAVYDILSATAFFG